MAFFNRIDPAGGDAHKRPPLLRSQEGKKIKARRVPSRRNGPVLCWTNPNPPRRRR